MKLLAVGCDNVRFDSNGNIPNPTLAHSPAVCKINASAVVGVVAPGHDLIRLLLPSAQLSEAGPGKVPQKHTASRGCKIFVDL